jgi:hypothetical protein
MAFLTKLDLRAHEEPNEWVVLSMLTYYCLAFDGTINVPRGFITDLASIPRLLRAVFNVNGQTREAAVLHDYLYCSQGRLVILQKYFGSLTRAQCDRIFRDAMRDQGVNWLQRWTMWAGVRLGGWLYWRKRNDGMCADYDFVPNTYWSE